MASRRRSKLDDSVPNQPECSYALHFVCCINRALSDGASFDHCPLSPLRLTLPFSSPMAPKTWLITGCTSGFGADFVHEAIKRGDKAIATGRGDLSRLSALKKAGAHVYTLDVTAPSDTINATVAKMIEEVGDIDVLVNNAGDLAMGLVSELQYVPFCFLMPSDLRVPAFKCGVIKWRQTSSAP